MHPTYTVRYKMAGNSKPAKRKDLCLSNRILVIEKLEKKATQCEVAKEFGISPQVPSVAHLEDEAKAFIRSSRQHKLIAEKQQDYVTSWIR